MKRLFVPGFLVAAALLAWPGGGARAGEPDLKAAEERFLESCAACHGEKGKGDGPAGKLFPIQLPDFTNAEYMKGLSDEYLRQIISKGGAPMGRTPFMPGFGAVLGAAEIENLVAYLRTLPKK
ncbi:MAG: cytochrome c [Bdellovibrionota bacterium]